MTENTIIENLTTDEERALYGIRNKQIKNCTFKGELDGESCLKETNQLRINSCDFYLRYPLWHNYNSKIRDCYFAPTCRAPLWYCRNLLISKAKVEGVKALRECKEVTLEKSEFISTEFGWKCSELNFYDCSVESEYPFFMTKNAFFDKFKLKGKYSFQYTQGITICKSVLNTKDAFWHSKNVTVSDSEINGEYLGWYSEGLKLIRCKIKGTQPLCYCKDLILEDCTMEDADLAFEHSLVSAVVKSKIDSVKNPVGSITAEKIDDIIIDEYSRGHCEFIIKK